MTQSNPGEGLTTPEVQSRIRDGLVNHQPKGAGKTVRRIVADNVFTFFNLINAALGTVVLWAGSYKNALFLGVSFFNTLIGIIQELRAKRTLDRLSLLNRATVTVVRDGRETGIDIEELVMDDLMILRAGQQICADAELEGGCIEVNEALLTGESDAILKGPGDALLSGSYVVSGEAPARVVRVGLDGYANRITAEARVMRKHPSELRDAMNRILMVVSFIIVPLGAGYFLRQQMTLHLPTSTLAIGTVAAVLGMIPEGLVLLTSVALAAGVVNLGKRSTLVRELFCLETLARVDVLCLDKTGTLTEGTMKVREVIALAQAPIDEIMGNLMRALPTTNATGRALFEHFPTLDTMLVEDVLPFSSARKYGGATLDARAHRIGAFEFLFDADARDPALAAQIDRCALGGARVLVLVRDDLPGTATRSAPEPLALILLGEEVRKSAKQTLGYFREQGTDLLILSGDHPSTLSAIAQDVEFPNAENCVDASTLSSEADIKAALRTSRIFGRVQPEQKKQIVLALKAAGHTVAMVGDGVNDVPALKQSDCSVAMANGSDAAKQSANLVLLDSDFSALPHVVNEGRRVINNIQSAASLFMVKTIFSILLTALMLIASDTYPFIPLHLTLIGTCSVGIPTFLFALEPNRERVRRGFFRHVLKNALPGALTIVLWVCLASSRCSAWGLSEAVRSTMCMIATGSVGLLLIPMVYPLRTLMRKAVFIAVTALFCGGCLLFSNLLQLAPLPHDAMILTALMVGLSWPLLMGLRWLFSRTFKA